MQKPDSFLRTTARELFNATLADNEGVGTIRNDDAPRVASCPSEGWCAGGAKSVITPTQPQIDGVTELGAAYLGGTPLAELALAGRVVERRPGALAAASTAFGQTPAPWCPRVF